MACNGVRVVFVAAKHSGRNRARAVTENIPPREYAMRVRVGILLIQANRIDARALCASAPSPRAPERNPISVVQRAQR